VRIIGGTHKGRIIKVPQGLPVRPTTDFAKEGLFNILANKVDFEGLRVLDLFSGTGHISLEFASRGAAYVCAVDKNVGCANFLKCIASELKLEITVVKSDVFTFLKSAGAEYDLIFADPPYELPNIQQIHELVFSGGFLNEKGLLIIEHGPKTNLNDLSGFTQKRKYGNVNFSFFENNNAG
jgi:16S rRNA (guanine(966)-N(2))-methyltransferase RsmD